MRLRHVLATAAAGAFVLATAPTAAATGTETNDVGGWKPYTQPEFTVPAGVSCSFPLHVDVVRQDLRTRVLARYPDGGVRRQEFAGPLIVDFVNTRTGESVRRNTSGHTFAVFRKDGSFLRYTAFGPIGLGFRAKDTYPKGYYVLGGLHVITFDADGTRHMALDLGPEENICKDLD